MIGPEDIAAFEAAMEPAKEFRRRAEKGLPPDRWADGDVGMRGVAVGINAMEQMLQIYAEASANMLEEIRRANREAMGVFDRGGNETA